jgi:hypothetical protein
MSEASSTAVNWQKMRPLASSQRELTPPSKKKKTNRKGRAKGLAAQVHNINT